MQLLTSPDAFQTGHFLRDARRDDGTVLVELRTFFPFVDAVHVPKQASAAMVPLAAGDFVLLADRSVAKCQLFVRSDPPSGGGESGCLAVVQPYTRRGEAGQTWQRSGATDFVALEAVVADLIWAPAGEDSVRVLFPGA